MNSGNHFRFSKKNTVDQYISIDIKQLRKRCEWQFTSRGIAYQSGLYINLSILSDNVIVEWQRTQAAPQKQIIYTSQQPQYLGNYRYYLICPNCNNRYEKLYFQHGFYCRKCLYLTYQSCQDSHKFDRFAYLIGMQPAVYNRISKHMYK